MAPGQEAYKCLLRLLGFPVPPWYTMANYVSGQDKGRLYCSQLPPDVIPIEMTE